MLQRSSQVLNFARFRPLARKTLLTKRSFTAWGYGWIDSVKRAPNLVSHDVDGRNSDRFIREIPRNLRALSGVARVLVATAAFTGLRRSEIRGLRWEDYEPGEERVYGEIRVERSVWRTEIQPTKTRRSRASVPVIPRAGKNPRGISAWAGESREGIHLRESTQPQADGPRYVREDSHPTDPRCALTHLALVASVPPRPRDEPPSPRR